MKFYYMKEYFKLDGRSFIRLIHHLYSQKIINKLIIFFKFGILIKENKSKKRSSYKKKNYQIFFRSSFPPGQMNTMHRSYRVMAQSFVHITLPSLLRISSSLY